MAMVVMAYGMVVLRGVRPGREGETVPMRGGNSSAVQCMMNHKGRGGIRTGAPMRILGAMEAKGGWYFQAKHVKRVDNKLADGIMRGKREDSQSNLVKREPPKPCGRCNRGERRSSGCVCRS